MTSDYSIVAVVLLCAGALTAQDSRTIAPSPSPATPIDVAKLISDVRASYYHPDDLAVVDCDVTLDVDSLVKQLSLQNAAASRIHAINGMTVQVHALRDQAATFQVAWPQGIPDTKERIEQGVKGVVGSFFQMDWNLMSPSLIPGADKVRAEPREGGGYTLRSAEKDTKQAIEVDRSYVPETSISHQTPNPAGFRS